jgi:G:T/U-mismatch repair DNA glycosylase
MSFVETHPFHHEHPIPVGTSTLVVGTAPPPRFSNPNCAKDGVHRLDMPFFYGSGNNLFWKIMNMIAASLNRPLPNDAAPAPEYLPKACDFLRQHGIWMKDALQTYQRTKECSASDSHIRPPKMEDLADFLWVIQEHRSVKRFAFTAKLAAEWTFCSLQRLDLFAAFTQELAARKRSPNRAPGIDGDPECSNYAGRFLTPLVTAAFGDRDIEFYQLPSPSPADPKPKGVTDNCLAQIYKDVLFRA